MALPLPDADDGDPALGADQRPPPTALAALTALRAEGADRSDPVQYRRLEALAERAARYGGALGDELNRRLEAHLAEYSRRQSDCGSGHETVSLRERYPSAAGQLDALHGRGDFAALERLARRLAADAERDELLQPLRALVGQLAGPHVEGEAKDGAAPPPDVAPRELKAVRGSRATWSRLAVDRQLSRSLHKAPDNAGPLNSHALVLRALQQLDAIAPSYLARFVSHVETLLWLEGAVQGSVQAPDRPVPRDAAAAVARSTAKPRSTRRRKR